MVGLVRQMIAPLKLEVSPALPRRVNLLMSTIDFQYVYAGYLAMFHLAMRLARTSHHVRIVLVEACDYDPAGWRREIAGYPGLESLFDTVETSYHLDRSVPLPVSPTDAFIATSCWTAHIAHRAVRDLGRERFVFFAQEYEPIFFPMGSLHALAEQAYTLPQFTVFSTDFLLEYFREHRLGAFAIGHRHAARSIVHFRNAVSVFDVRERELALREKRRLVFYARPEPHAARNMFELGVLALSEAVREGHFERGRWQFEGIGSLGPARSIPLDGDVDMRLRPRVNLREYRALLSTYDVGLSLMLSPHPSLVPIEMAAAGLVTVTNTYACKTAERWAAVSSNIIAVPPTIDGIKTGLVTAIARAERFRDRAAGARIDWCTSWDQAFDARVLTSLEGFMRDS